MSKVSIVVPSYNESENLPVLYQRLCRTMRQVDDDWELVVVDDHSRDDSFGLIVQLASKDPRVRGIRLARNHGSHAAITCGLHHACGDCAIVLAADLQDPPEIITEFLAPWRKGARVVWAERAERKGLKASERHLSRLYYWVLRRVAGIKDMPSTGTDCMLVDRCVLDAFRQFHESNVSIMALITWMGFKQTIIPYTKQARLHGSSGWTLERKLKMMVDSITSFTYLPIRFMSYLGFVFASLGFGVAAFVIVNTLRGVPVPRGWPTLVVLILVIGGMQMLMMGVLGEYLWRALDEARRRPQYLIESTVGIGEDSEKRRNQSESSWLKGA